MNIGLSGFLNHGIDIIIDRIIQMTVAVEKFHGLSFGPLSHRERAGVKVIKLQIVTDHSISFRNNRPFFFHYFSLNLINNKKGLSMSLA